MLNAPLSSCRRFHPARVARRVGQDWRDPCCLRPAVVGSASGAPYFRGQFAFTSLRPDDSLPTLTMGLPMGFRVLVSRHPAIHATRLLTLASVGLPPTEHVSLHCCFWTHNGADGFPVRRSPAGFVSRVMRPIAGRAFRRDPSTAPGSPRTTRASYGATPYSTASSRSPVGPSPASCGAVPSSRPNSSRC